MESATAEVVKPGTRLFDNRYFLNLILGGAVSRYLHSDIAMRTLIGLGTALNFCIMGPVMVGLAALVH